jgi:hypothetical protein
LLALDPRDLGVLQQLGVETHEFLAERSDGAEPPHTIDPGQHILDPARQRRWEPAVTTPPLGEARRTGTGVALSPAAADRPPRQKAIAHLLAAMGELRRPDHSVAAVMDNRQIGGLAARIDLEP